METLLYGYVIICVLCFIRSIYRALFKKDEELEERTQQVVYLFNTATNSNISLRTVKVLTVLLNILTIPILPILIFIIKNDKEEK